MKILAIEDDRDIAELLEFNLQQEKFNVTICENGKAGLVMAQEMNPELIILDLMLPDMDGLEVCRNLKTTEKTKHIPIIMLTAKSEEVDRIVGFEVGADDYITKPFSTRELILRVRAILRRAGSARKNEEVNKIFQFGILTVDPQKFKVSVGNSDIKMTALEFRLLQYLYQSQGRVASRDMLLDQVWGYDAILTTRTVDTHIKRLREKLGDAGAYIETVRGVGYRFRESLEAS